MSIGGIEQWITIRGDDRNNPALLFLHGGPGDVTNPWAFAFFTPWEKYFTVVQWDQRGAGRTLRTSGRAVAFLVTGPFGTSRATSAEILKHWRALTGRQGHPADPQFANYLEATLSTVILDGPQVSAFRQLLERLAGLMGADESHGLAGRLDRPQREGQAREIDVDPDAFRRLAA